MKWMTILILTALLVGCATKVVRVVEVPADSTKVGCHGHNSGEPDTGGSKHK